MALAVTTAPAQTLYAGNTPIYNSESTTPYPVGIGTQTPKFNYITTEAQELPTLAPRTESAATTAARAAASAEASRIAGLRTSLNASANNYYTGARTQLGDVGNTYAQNNRDFVNGILDQQESINGARTNNGLNLRRSMATIAAGVRNGIRSGGVSLANMNALDSGASDALARAYAQEGNQQGSDANNQAALVDQEQMAAQGRLNRDRDAKLQDFGTYRGAEVNRIGTGLQSDLSVLDATGVSGGVNGGVDFSQKDSIINDAINRLNQIDAERNQRLGGQRQLSAEDIQAQAAAMDAAGAAGTTPFAVDTTSMLQPAGGSSGAAISQLPIYTRRRQY